MREWWDGSDAAIRITYRSICTLLARQVIRRPLEETGPQLCWLHDVTENPLKAIYGADVVTRDRMNLKSFVCGVLSNQVGDLLIEMLRLSRKHSRFSWVQDTMPHFDTITSRNRLSEEVGWIQQIYPQGSREEVVTKLRLIFPFLPTYPRLPLCTRLRLLSCPQYRHTLSRSPCLNPLPGMMVNSACEILFP